MSARTRSFTGPVHGRTHRSAPIRGSIREPTEICARNGPPPTGRDGARPLQGDREWTDGGARLGSGGVLSPRPTEATQVVPSEGPIWASAPTGRRGGSRNHPGQRRTAERLRRGWEEWVGIAAGTIPKGGSPPRLPGQRLAKRKARKEQLVKFSLYPMPSECSTAHRVPKPQQNPARALVGVTSTEQDRLEPRPAARQGAPRP